MFPSKFEETKTMSNEDFMAWLLDALGPLMWHTAKKYCRNADLWAEIIQESVVYLLSCVSKLRTLSEKNLLGYVVVTVRNTAYSLLRKEARERERCISLESIDIVDDGPMPEEVIVRQEELEALAKACESLPEETYYLLTSYYFLDMPTEALAEELGCSPGSIRMKLTRARRQVKKRLGKKEESL